MSDEPKKEGEKIKPMINESPDIWQMIDWVFLAGAPIGDPEEESEEGEEDENKASGDGP